MTGSLPPPRHPLHQAADPPDPAALLALEDRNRGCAACPLRVSASQVVVSDGDPRAPLLIVGEGPGAEEDRDGRPFVGQAGQLLDRILAAASLAREEAYLTNVTKCRAPNNRTPLPLETATCTGLWLEPQLALLRPRVVLSLGNTATQFLLGTPRGITRLRGQWFTYRHPAWPQPALLMPLLHPAYLLRNPVRTPGGPKSLTWRDIREVAAVLRGEKEASPVQGQFPAAPDSLFSELE
ncbi:uracil-DNA glycosylase [Deinococcus radiodurans]|mgnify:CR=1 FL=1|jgi:uracil-DNA glycosylase, family 4|uniref:Type-4 uracil-DNA glycosylase n=1 Tax=Deinococcus radiodurans (strain ATCC 13939 / DSM 20539 / JCM 16871 / CCUG 27074 / LMG 4051 / NBRC 15346 / NCIMB 9279 / VKM B-1422 / R1) TaxID=243230 RepID=Q9RTK9_DEIRA|nr:uracil-DNA glycosylase [Deinococcus radiodurans]AAF11304.1 DNA polymerase-related protein [Deinococcus radiodurans R1 = ATCC 13939 = DSM 20539]ANC71151.1 uracil-DNA glycosylase [Deinococcus radiodurans R1 = ATCC 13939 = DSM 20539]QEM71173.1 uracil-DNA glycosylase [Deinococcus radiodurans]QIP29719.1 uracil-DNA glycosylase [Deinococcus radiodurans]QIP31602.1 uracil-DNA glycosylase [Deinococcus radiodurans]